ncbi:iron chelate uptake ABC transporter family permease subunit, partial [Candidatus Bipolaricaulota bacterium]|nr:iron chelate uptake ABC transporter family permease subunit [Candidatus Bipolaricaulota bacterium]
MIRRPRSTIRVVALLVAVAAGVFVVGVAIGPVMIPLKETLAAIFGGSDPEGARSSTAIIIHQVRLPRVILGFLVGGALAVSGTVMQGLFRNPLGSPYILGVASGASAGAAV